MSKKLENEKYKSWKKLEEKYKDLQNYNHKRLKQWSKNYNDWSNKYDAWSNNNPTFKPSKELSNRLNRLEKIRLDGLEQNRLKREEKNKLNAIKLKATQSRITSIKNQYNIFARRMGFKNRSEMLKSIHPDHAGNKIYSEENFNNPTTTPLLKKKLMNMYNKKVGERWRMPKNVNTDRAIQLFKTRIKNANSITFKKIKLNLTTETETIKKALEKNISNFEKNAIQSYKNRIKKANSNTFKKIQLNLNQETETIKNALEHNMINFEKLKLENARHNGALLGNRGHASAAANVRELKRLHNLPPLTTRHGLLSPITQRRVSNTPRSPNNNSNKQNSN